MIEYNNKLNKLHKLAVSKHPSLSNLILQSTMSISEAMIIRASGEYDCEVVVHLKLEDLSEFHAAAISVLIISFC